MSKIIVWRVTRIISKFSCSYLSTYNFLSLQCPAMKMGMEISKMLVNILVKLWKIRQCRCFGYSRSKFMFNRTFICLCSYKIYWIKATKLCMSVKITYEWVFRDKSRVLWMFEVLQSLQRGCYFSFSSH